MATARVPSGRSVRSLQASTRRAGLLFAGTLLVGGAIGSAGRVGAEGALAVGLPADIAKQGLAVGWAVDHATTQAAEAEALGRCRAAREPPQATRELCRIVESFDDKCVAVALDPDAGTSGLGWAVAESRDAAEAGAMEDCRQSAGEARRTACRIMLTRCDGG